MDDIRKRRKRCTTRRIYSPFLSSLPSPIKLISTSSNRWRWNTKLRQAGYRVVEKAGDNGWDTQRTDAMHGQRKKNYVDSTLFPTGFWWGCKWFGIRKGTNREGPTLHHFTSSILLRGKLLESISTTPILLSFTRSPTFIGRHAHLEDVAIPTRQRW